MGKIFLSVINWKDMKICLKAGIPNLSNVKILLNIDMNSFESNKRSKFDWLNSVFLEASLRWKIPNKNNSVKYETLFIIEI